MGVCLNQSITSVLYFSHARGALRFGLEQLGICTGNRILVPDYICDVVPLTLREIGLVPTYYPVDDGLAPQWDALPRFCCEDTCALMMVHYFGQPQDVDRFAEFAAKRRLYLIEDNAHGFGGFRNGRLLGTFGDVGISSPRKVLDIRNGGILHWGRGNVPEQPHLLRQPGFAGMWSLKRAIRRFLGRSLFVKRLRRRRNYMSLDEGREGDLPFWAADREAVERIETVDLTRLAAERRGCWEVWNSWARTAGMRPVFDTLDSGSSPWCYPVRVDIAEDRRYWFDWGWQHGFDVHSWPALPTEVIVLNYSGYRHWRTIVCFPISADLTPTMLENILGKIPQPNDQCRAINLMHAHHASRG